MRFSISFVFLSQLLFGQKPHQSAEIIIQAFEEKLETKVHLTPHLFNIARGGHLLDEEKKERLKDLGFDFNHMLVNRGGTQRAEGRGLDQYYDTGYFRIHFTTIGRNAVNEMDQNANNIPDYIESVAKIFDIGYLEVFKIGLLILLAHLYAPYPINNSSPPSPDKQTVTCLFAIFDTSIVGRADESANGSSK